MVVKAKILWRVVGPSRGFVPSIAEVVGYQNCPQTEATTDISKSRTVGGTELAQLFIMTFVTTSSYSN